MFRTKGEGLRGVRAEGSIMATPSPLRHETTRADSVFRDGDGPRRISKDDYTTTEEDESRNGFEASTFNPDVLNKFLEEYASKIKGSTEKYQRYPFRIVKPSEPLPLEVDEQQTTVRSPIIDHQEQNTKYEEEAINSTSTEDGVRSLLTSLSFFFFCFFSLEYLTISVGRDFKRHDKEEQVLRGELVRRQERLGHVGGDTVVQEQDIQMASDPEHATAVARSE